MDFKCSVQYIYISTYVYIDINVCVAHHLSSIFVLLFLLDGMQFMCVQTCEHEIKFGGRHIMQDYPYTNCV